MHADVRVAADTIAVPERRLQSPLRRALVHGPSMVPTLRHGDHIVVWLRPPRRLRVGAVVVAELPGATSAVKRIVAVHPDGRVWLEGDNPVGSTDSRSLGPVAPEAVRGTVLARLWPRPRLLRAESPDRASQ